MADESMTPAADHAPKVFHSGGLLAVALTVFLTASVLIGIIATGFPCHGREASLIGLLVSANLGVIVALLAAVGCLDRWRRPWQLVVWWLLVVAALTVPNALLNLVAFVASGNGCVR
jgi:hypothetical protein